MLGGSWRKVLSWDVQRPEPNIPELSRISPEMRALFSRSPYRELIIDESVDLDRFLRQRKVLVNLLDSGIIDIVNRQVSLTDSYKRYFYSIGVTPVDEIRQVREIINSIDIGVYMQNILDLIPPAVPGYLHPERLRVERSVTLDEAGLPLRELLEKLRTLQHETSLARTIDTLGIRMTTELVNQHEAELFSKARLRSENYFLGNSGIHFPAGIIGRRARNWDMNFMFEFIPKGEGE